MKRLIRLGAMIILALGAARARGSIIVAEQNWNNGNTAGWTSDESWVTLSNPGSGGLDNTGYLQVALAAAETAEDDPNPDWYALARTPASSFFAGNWAGKWVEFDFLAETVAPKYVQVQWSSSTNDVVWRSTVYDGTTGSMPVGSWTHLVAPHFTSYEEWDYGGGNQEAFINDLTTIDWIGVYLWRGSNVEQNYGVDNFRLMVPEPHEYLMFASAILAAAWSFRSRLSAAPALIRQFMPRG